MPQPTRDATFGAGVASQERNRRATSSSVMVGLPRSAQVADVGGLNVHAGDAVDGRDRRRLEQLYRYMARPPLCQERLAQDADGRLAYSFRKPWKDGTKGILLEPLDFIARLCAIIPPPRFHQKLIAKTHQPSNSRGCTASILVFGMSYTLIGRPEPVGNAELRDGRSRNVAVIQNMRDPRGPDVRSRRVSLALGFTSECPTAANRAAISSDVNGKAALSKATTRLQREGRDLDEAETSKRQHKLRVVGKVCSEGLPRVADGFRIRDDLDVVESQE